MIRKFLYKYLLLTFFAMLFVLPFSKAQDLKKYFEAANITGSITLFDLNQQMWIKSDEQDAERGTLPASTFKMFHTLIALEEGVIDGANDTLTWDGIAKTFKGHEIAAWNQDTDLTMAFKKSTVWYYVEIAKQIKRACYRKYLRKAKYSDRQIKQGKANDFWNYGQLKVKPVEQINFLRRLYKNDLPFKKAHQMLLKELMEEGKEESYTLRSKTGWAFDGRDIGWYVGYVEYQSNTIFFATRIQKALDKEQKDFSKLRKSITKEILTDLYAIPW